MRRFVPVLPLLLLACSEPQPAAELPPRPVRTVVVAPEPVAETRFLAGEVRAAARAALSFAAEGRLAEILVEVGERVEEGQTLARLDPVPFRLRLEQAAAERDRAVATLRERERRAASIATLHAAGHATRFNHDGAQAELATARGNLRAAEASLALAERDLRNATLRAPFPGRVATRDAEPQADLRPGQAVLALDGAGPAEVILRAPASLLPHLAPGTRLEVRVAAAANGTAIPATVVQAGGRGEGGLTFPVIARLDAPASVPLRAGLVADATLTLGEGRRAILLPEAAVLPGAPEASVIVVEEGRARRRPVRLGPARGGRIEVTEGLRGGEVVVTVAPSFLTEGQVVLVTPAAAVATLARPE
jgi:multidrug efflux system membrane fusion protein